MTDTRTRKSQESQAPRQVVRLGSAVDLTRALSTGAREDGSATTHNRKWDDKTDIERSPW